MAEAHRPVVGGGLEGVRTFVDAILSGNVRTILVLI